MILTLKDLSVYRGVNKVVDSISLSVDEGQWWMLTGPNGAGKSTLVEAVAQGVRYEGDTLIDNQDAKKLCPQALARRIAVLSQLHETNFAFSVEDVVSLGRYAYAGGVFKHQTPDDEAAIEQALDDVGLTQLRKRSMLSLSGGERQRVFLAQVFAQNPKLMLLDEPANHLDLKYQKQLFGFIRQWLKTPGRAVLSVVHDLSLARLYGTHFVLMKKGKCISLGSADDVLSPDILSSVYGMDVYSWMRDLLRPWQHKR